METIFDRMDKNTLKYISEECKSIMKSKDEFARESGFSADMFWYMVFSTRDGWNIYNTFVRCGCESLTEIVTLIEALARINIMD